jgi:formate/nitrite transporter
MSDSLAPSEIVAKLIDIGAAKAQHGIPDLLIRGSLSGALLGFGASLALLVTAQTGLSFVGALVFPVGFAMIVVLGLELLTSNFGIVPLAVLTNRATARQMVSNWIWVFVGNLLGSLIYAGLLYVVLTEAGHAAAGTLGDQIRALAEAKTLTYEPNGDAGLLTAFVKAILCNWMVCLGMIMGNSSTSMTGRILGCWLPIFAFFAMGFEHSVVNLFVIPLGMALGAKISFYDWWYWNEIPALLGNLVGGFATGLALYTTYKPHQSDRHSATITRHPAMSFGEKSLAGRLP